MNTCDTCKYWEDDFKFPDTTHEKKKICSKIMLTPVQPPGKSLVPKEDGVCVDTYQYAFYTGPKFGCIHHEPKNTSLSYDDARDLVNHASSEEMRNPGTLLESAIQTVRIHQEPKC